MGSTGASVGSTGASVGGVTGATVGLPGTSHHAAGQASSIQNFPNSVHASSVISQSQQNCLPLHLPPEIQPDLGATGGDVGTGTSGGGKHKPALPQSAFQSFPSPKQSSNEIVSQSQQYRSPLHLPPATQPARSTGLTGACVGLATGTAVLGGTGAMVN